MQQVKRISRRRWPDEVYRRAQGLVDEDPGLTAAAIADRLAEEFDRAPSESTVRDWLQNGTIRVPQPGDYWRLGLDTDPVEARAILRAFAWLHAKSPTRIAGVTTERAAWVAKVTAIAPEAPVRATIAYADLYRAGDPDADRLLAMDIATDWEDWATDSDGVPAPIAKRLGSWRTK